MPIYEYRCGKGHTFEVMQRMSDDPVAVCTTCSQPVERVFHPIAIHFKGSGFYNTDYGTRNRSRELKNAAEGSGKSSTDAGSKKSGGDSTSSSKSETSSGKTASASD